MRLALAVLLLASTSLAAFAGDVATPSRVAAVTVYPRGADVTRTAAVTLAAGPQRLLLSGLPEDVDTTSIRVEGEGPEGLLILSVDSKAVPVLGEANDQVRRETEAALKALADERAALDLGIADAEAQKQFLMGLGRAPLPAGASPTPDAATLGPVLDLMAAKFAALSKTIQEARVRQRKIDEEAADLNRKLETLAPDGSMATEVAVNVTAAQAGAATFKVKYRVAAAGWQPLYDARLSTGGKGGTPVLLVSRQAEVTQQTGESWEGVALALSTARPGGATAAPELMESEVGPWQPPVPMAQNGAGWLTREKAGGAPSAAPEAMVALDAAAPEAVAADKPAEMQQAGVVMAGFQAVYVVPGLSNVDNSGTARKMAIGSDTYEPTLSALAVPRLDPHAYLTASFTAELTAPMLPGRVSLYRDGVFMGEGGLPLLNGGEVTKLGFGVDDLVSVKVQETKREAGEEGLLTTSNSEVRAYDISLKNLHDFALPVTVMDRMPFATHEDIKVEAVSGASAPTTRDVDGKRGVSAWAVELAPGAEQVVKTGYKITWPKAMKLLPYGD